MDIIVKGRRTDVNDRFKRHVESKIAKIEKLDSKIIRVDVEVSAERNPRLADQRERVELTIHSRGPVIRAEAAADDRHGALDLAIDKLEGRLRRTADRRKVHHGSRTPAKLSGLEPLPPELAPEPAAVAVKQRAARTDEDLDAKYAPLADPGIDDHVLQIENDGDCPVLVREKFHKAAPMDIDQALYEMELVGHDFFLFRDKDNGQPTVVYRRRGWDYGVIRLIEE